MGKYTQKTEEIVREKIKCQTNSALTSATGQAKFGL